MGKFLAHIVAEVSVLKTVYRIFKTEVNMWLGQVFFIYHF